MTEGDESVVSDGVSEGVPMISPDAPATQCADEMTTLVKLLDAQTKRGDAMGAKFAERGERIAVLEQENAELRRQAELSRRRLDSAGASLRALSKRAADAAEALS